MVELGAAFTRGERDAAVAVRFEVFIFFRVFIALELMIWGFVTGDKGTAAVVVANVVVVAMN